MTNEQSGSPISATQAGMYLKKYREIRSNLKLETPVPLTQPTVIGPKEASEVDAFYNSEVNAFIFSKDLILRFFEDQDQNGKVADFLMIILGAKYDEQQPQIVGNPTVVVAGVIKDPSDPQKYLSMNTPNAADEQPPTTSLVEFPGHAFDSTPFTINITL